MNANEMVPKTNNARLNRIQKISRRLKVCVLIYLLAPLCLLTFQINAMLQLNGIHLAPVSVFGHTYASVADIPAVMIVLSGLGAAVYLLGIICFYRLLDLFAKGIFFSASNVLQLERLGSCLVGFGIFALAADMVHTGKTSFPMILFDGIASPWIVAGVAVYLIAWIMDEGRKIQEEQELTV